MLYVKTLCEWYVPAIFFQKCMARPFWGSKLYCKKVIKFDFQFKIRVQIFFCWENVSPRFEILFYHNLDLQFVQVCPYSLEVQALKQKWGRENIYMKKGS